MNDYLILTDSTTDLPNDLAMKLGIEVASLKFIINGKEYTNYLDERELSSKEFYNLVREGAMPKTSCVNVEEYENIMRPYLEKGQDVIYFAFSSKLSGTFNSFLLAKQSLEEEFPDRKIIGVDTLSVCSGEGLIVYLACQQKAKGLTIDELEIWAKENIMTINQWFTVDDIDHLKRGGRLSNAAAFVAKLLRIKPILCCNDTGHLVAVKKAKGRKNSIEILCDKFINNYEYRDGEPFFITHADCESDAKVLENMIKSKYTGNLGEIIINSLGPVTGGHTGPGALTIFFRGKYQTREK